MPMSTYPNGFADGLSVRGMPINMAYPGKVIFVNNSGVLAANGGNASDLNPGTYQLPKSTIAGALLACVANRGDIIMLMPGHAETVSSATGLLMNVAGVLVVGLGTGTKQAVITLDTANTATIAVSAANIGFVNCRFVANFLAIASCFTLTTAAGFLLSRCSFRDTSAILNFAKIILTSSTDNAADGLTIEECGITSSHATNAFSVIGAVGTLDRLMVRDSVIRSVTTNAAAALAVVTNGKILTNAVIRDNIFNTVGATGTATGLLITTNQSTNRGSITGNFVQNLATSPILANGSSGFIYFQNFVQDAADASGILIPAGA